MPFGVSHDVPPFSGPADQYGPFASHPGDQCSRIGSERLAALIEQRRASAGWAVNATLVPYRAKSATGGWRTGWTIETDTVNGMARKRLPIAEAA